MYKSHHDYYCPPDETIIWKYMDLFKYLDLISTRKLFLQRTDLFLDKSEGLDKNTRKDYAKFHSVLESELSEDFYIRNKNQNSDFRRRTFLSSWHINDYESSIMWDAYSDSNAGILLKSTVGRLKNSLTGRENVHIAKVNYLDGPTPLGNSHRFLAYKAPIYVDERELRVIHIMNYGSNGMNINLFPNVENLKFIKIEIDLNELIDSVLFHPLTENWKVVIMSNIITQIQPNLVPEKSKIYS